MFMPHSSGQRQGLVRYIVEMAQSVSPFLTVYVSGALGASSERGTPAWATCWAVARCCGVMVRFWACAGSAANAAASTAAACQASGGRPARALRCAIIFFLLVAELDKSLAILRSSP